MSASPASSALLRTRSSASTDPRGDSDFAVAANGRPLKRTYPSPPPAIVIGGGDNALSIARSLTVAGVAVHALGCGTSPVRHSRSRRRFVDCGVGAEAPGCWMKWLKQGPQAGVLLPCSDEALEFVAQRRAALERLGYRAVEADDEVLLAMLDKDRTYARAREIGIETPKAITVRDPQELEAAAEEVGYPCALKPLHSHVFARHFKQKVLRIERPDELHRHFDRLQELDLEMMVTEIVPGGDDQYSSYYSYLDQDGQPLFHFTKRKLRQHPTGFGLISYQVTDWDPEVAELGLRFFQGVGLRGIGNVEFKRDARDGRPKLIECNPRFTAANELVRQSGIDLALLAYERALGLPGPLLDGYRENMYMWHPLKDVRAFLEYRREGPLTFATWARSLLRRQRFPVFSLSDPLPTLVKHSRLVGRLMAGEGRRHLASTSRGRAGDLTVGEQPRS